MIAKLNVSERRACLVIGISRTVFKYTPKVDPFEDELRSKVIELSTLYGRYGYRKITEILNNQGVKVGKDRVWRIWREEGLKVPSKQPKRARIWHKNGNCVRKRPEYKNHVWSYDFVSEKTHSGQKIRILNIIDEHTRECLVSYVALRIRSKDIIFILAGLFMKHGMPKYIRSDNGPEFVSKKLIAWFKLLGVSPFVFEKNQNGSKIICQVRRARTDVRDTYINWSST